jgi:hypothetical protein
MHHDSHTAKVQNVTPQAVDTCETLALIGTASVTLPQLIRLQGIENENDIVDDCSSCTLMN